MGWAALFRGVLVLVLLSAPGAEATGRPDVSLQALHDLGRVAFRDGRYQDAAEAFERAFARDPHPVLLWNIGRAYEEATRWGAARDAFVRYRSLRGVSQAQRVEAALKLLEIERHLVATGERRRVAGQVAGRLLAAASLRLEPGEAPAEMVPRRPAGGAVLSMVDTPDVVTDDPDVWGPSVLAAGVAVAMAGAITLGVAYERASDLDDVALYLGRSRGDALAVYEARGLEVEALEIGGWVALGLGVASAIAAGLSWWSRLAPSGPQDAAEVSVGVDPLPAGASVTVRGGF